MASSKHTRKDGDEALAARNGNGHGDNEDVQGTALSSELDDNPAFQDAMSKTLAELAPEEWVQADIGFPAYWKADLAKGFRGVVLYRDERDPTFVRYHIENRGPTLDCQKGPTDSDDIVRIRSGQVFTISAWGALPLDRFFGLEVVVLVSGQRKLPPNAESKGLPRKMWEFKVFTSKETDKLLASRRAEDIAYLAEVQRNGQRKAMEEIARINAAARANRLTA